MSAFETKPAAVEQPWEAEIDGVPTHQVAHRDDGDAVMTVDKSGYKLDAKEKSLTRTATSTTTEGDVTDTSTRAHSVKVDKDGGTLGRTTSEEHKVGEGDGAITSKTGKTRSINGGKKGGGIAFGSETEVTAGDKVKGHSKETSFGYKDGFEFEHKRTSKEGNEHNGREKERSFAFKDDKVSLNFTDKHEYNKRKEGDVEKKDTRTSNANVEVGKDSLGASVGRKHVSDSGTTRAVTAGFNVNKDGSASANAGYNRTTKSGTKLSAAVNAGIRVEADEPVEVAGGRWEVTYKKIRSVGASAGGGAKDVSVNIGGSHESYDIGRRSFKTKEEAADFRKHAAERVRGDVVDPRSISGAMSMEVGETLGHGESTSGTAGAGIEKYGFGVSGSLHTKSTDEVSVRRVSANLFEVTATADSTEGKDGKLKAPGASLTHGDSSNQGVAQTVRFDLSTEEGRAGFTEFCQTQKLPRTGGQLLSRTESQGHEVHDGVSLLGTFDMKDKSRTWESRTYDAEGKHEEFGGEKTRDKTPGWLGRNLFDEKELHEKVTLVGQQEDDKTADYTVSASFGGKDGSATRNNLGILAGATDEKFDDDLKASGTWNMSADIPLASIKKIIASDERFKHLKGNDAQMKAFTDFVAKGGKHAVHEMEQRSGRKLAWDLELAGDPNFPGKAGRVAVETKVEKYAELMQLSKDSPEMLVGQIQGEMDALAERRAQIADPKKYPDLPDELRLQQLELVDYQIRQFAMVRHQGAVAMSKRQPGEGGDAIGGRLQDEHGYDDLPPEQRALARVQDEIAVSDEVLADLEARNREAEAAIFDAMRHYTDGDRADQAGAGAANDRKDLYELGELTSDQHVRQTLKVDDLRMAFIKALSEPEKAAALGEQLNARLREQISLAGDALEKLDQSARIQAAMNSPRAVAASKHAAFWTDLEDTMDSSLIGEREDPEPARPVSMRL